MAQILRRAVRYLAVPLVATLVLVPAVGASAGTQGGGSREADSQAAGAALTRVFQAAGHVPRSAVGGIRPGTLRTGTANGHRWAMASFEPAEGATPEASVAFQDGGATGVFEQAGGQWHLVRTGSGACGTGLPASLRAAWHIAAPAARCSTPAATQRTSAARALSALPAPARSSASAAVKGAAVNGAAGKTAAPAAVSKQAAADPADLGPTIAAIALSQVGHAANPVVTNFEGVDCDPYSTMVAGFSANSNGCGYDTAYNVRNENETWCSDFNKWVWERAGITEDINTINAGAVSYYQWATAHGQKPQPDTGTPRAGDSVLFFGKSSFPGFADHVGIVTAVHPDGSIDMVNGDFDGGPAVAVEYDRNIANLAAFAQQAENDPTEEWILVSPPSTAQAPAPTGQLIGPATAVAGAAGQFHASGSVAGSSVSAYYWTFGDNRTTNATGPDVTHAFTEPGTYTVSVTITSAAGTAVTVNHDVHVVAPSAAVASAPTDGIWYDPLPVEQYTFTRSGGGLAADEWNGGGWLREPVPGDPSATGNITTLAYPDPGNADVTTPHAFYRASGGALAQTFQTASGWVSEHLPGSPAAGAAITATNTTSTTSISGDPEVFFIDRSGNLAETSRSGSTWSTRTAIPASELPGLVPSSLALADTASGPVLFAAGPAGTIRVASPTGDGWAGGASWTSRGIPAKTVFPQPTSPDRPPGLPQPASPGRPPGTGAPLAAFTTPDGHPAVVYASAGNTGVGGGLAEATVTGSGQVTVTKLPGRPKAGAALAATTYLLPSQVPATPGAFPGPYGSLTNSNATDPFGIEAFFMTASGAPAVSYDDGTGWKTAALPPVSGATGVAGATAFPFAEEPSNLFLSGPGGLWEETTGARSGDPSGSWTSSPLPKAASTWADRVILYAADPADATAAQAAARAAGLPASSVTTSFSRAWADALSGDRFLVLAVGVPAASALDYNTCGWSNPSALPAGGTPFSIVPGPLDAPPGADDYLNAASDSTADTQALATDLAYYALHGSYPPGVTSPPPTANPARTCSGSPS